MSSKQVIDAQVRSILEAIESGTPDIQADIELAVSLAYAEGMDAVSGAVSRAFSPSLVETQELAYSTAD